MNQTPILLTGTEALAVAVLLIVLEATVFYVGWWIGVLSVWRAASATL